MMDLLIYARQRSHVEERLTVTQNEQFSVVFTHH